MKRYEKPVIKINEELSEGIYAASGAGCYTVNAYITQIPQIGRGDYRIQLNAIHNADHTNNSQTLTIKFNQNVHYVSSNGELVYGDNTDTLIIEFSYWQNSFDNIGLGELVVTSDENLTIGNARLTD